MGDESSARLAAQIKHLTQGKRPEELTGVLASVLSNPESSLDAAKLVWDFFHRPDLVMRVICDAIKPYEKGGKPEKACDLVRHMAADGREAVPSIRSLIQSTLVYDTLWAAVDALAAVGPDSSSVAPELLGLLDHRSGRVASGAAHALARIGPSTLPALLEKLERGTPREQEFAADALGQIGSAAKDALPLLQRLGLDPPSDSKGDFATWMTLAMAEISLVPDFGLALLVMAKTESDEALVERARSALKRIGVSESKVIKQLRCDLAEAEKNSPAEAESLRDALKALTS